MIENALRITRYLIESLLPFLFFSPMQTVKNKKVQIAESITLIICTAGVKISFNTQQSLALDLILLVIISAVVLVISNKNYWTCLYFALIYTAVFSSMRLLPSIVIYLVGERIPVGVFYIVMVLGYVIAYIIFRIVPIKKVSKVSIVQWVIVIVLSAIIYYSKSIAGSFLNNPLIGEINIPYPLVITILSDALLVSFDRYILLKKENEEQTLINLSNEYNYKQALLNQKANQEISRAYHDLRNHILALNKIKSNERDGYINELLESIPTAEDLIETGNNLLDGLLGEKRSIARSNNISMSVDVDISPIDYISQVDICSIFGNALDNAIEGALNADGEDRFIRVKSSVSMGFVNIHICNSCLSTVSVRSAHNPLESTKRNKLPHGIGIKSMRAAVHKYGGNLNYEAADGVFSLYILFPKKE